MTSDALKLVERFTRTGADTIAVRSRRSTTRRRGRAVEGAFPLRREPGYGMFEYACHEGNYAMSEHPVRVARRRGRGPVMAAGCL